ncbi:MAG: hypothetical protein KGL92_03315 [Gammaproteobacteria bacterium]|nr:hypothetical protein [Gammaproteobacteria bacterium]
MELTITSVDYAPPELSEQVPIVINLLRELPGTDRPDYWLGEVQKPIRWLQDNHEIFVTHVVVAARWVGTKIAPGAKNLPVGIAYVIDQTLLNDPTLDFAKSKYVAIGFSHETSSIRGPARTGGMLGGRIGRFFGLGGKN